LSGDGLSLTLGPERAPWMRTTPPCWPRLRPGLAWLEATTPPPPSRALPRDPGAAGPTRRV
jgi:hypothetical protein